MVHKYKNIHNQTKACECNINIALQLDINVHSDGGSGVSSKVSNAEAGKEDDVNWSIPDFQTSPKIEFVAGLLGTILQTTSGRLETLKVPILLDKEMISCLS